MKQKKVKVNRFNKYIGLLLTVILLTVSTVGCRSKKERLEYSNISSVTDVRQSSGTSISKSKESLSEVTKTVKYDKDNGSVVETVDKVVVYKKDSIDSVYINTIEYVHTRDTVYVHKTLDVKPDSVINSPNFAIWIAILAFIYFLIWKPLPKRRD